MAETTDLQRLIVSFEANMKRYENQLAKGYRETDRRARQIQRRFDRLGQTVSRTMVALSSRVVAAMAAALSVREVIAYGDAWTRTGNMLQAAGVSAEALATAQNDLADLAVRSNSSFEDTVKLYARLANATREMGVSQSEVAIVVETLNKSFQLNGTTSAEAAGALTQFAQAMSSGVLRGEELNSILEQAPPIARAIAKEFGVSVGELKKLGEEGALSGQRVLDAIIKIAPETNEAFSKTQTTVDRALTNLSTRFTQFIGGVERELGQSAALAGLINLLADALDNLTPEQAAARIDVLNAKLAVLQQELTTIEALKADLLARDLTINTDSPAFQEAENRVRELRAEIAALKGEISNPATRVGSAHDIANASPLKDFTPKDKRKPPTDLGSGEKENAYEREIRQIKEATKAAELELSLIGQTEFARDKARASLELENAARRAGIKDIEAHRGEIDLLSEAYAQAAEAARKGEEFEQFWNDAAGAIAGFAGEAITDFKNIGDAVENLTQQLIQMVTQFAIVKPLQDYLGSAFGSIFGGGSGSVPMPMPRPAGLPKFHTGGTVPGAPGTEVPIMALAGERIIPRSAVRGGGGTVVQVIDQRRAGAPVETQRERGPDGREMIRMIVRDEVNSSIAQGKTDNSMRLRFGQAPRKIG